nr:MAG TPA: hypothetical protein [Caudoviricetes sp.]
MPFFITFSPPICCLLSRRGNPSSQSIAFLFLYIYNILITHR